MATRRAASPRKRRNRYYSRAKISERKFERVLWAFASHESASDAAQRLRLSVNTVADLYRRIRDFLDRAGFFDVFTELASVNEQNLDWREYTHTFHRKRMAERGGIRAGGAGSDLDERESCWRMLIWEFFDLDRMDAAYWVQYKTLLDFIREFGPLDNPIWTPRTDTRHPRDYLQLWRELSEAGESRVGEALDELETGEPEPGEEDSEKKRLAARVGEYAQEAAIFAEREKAQEFAYKHFCKALRAAMQNRLGAKWPGGDTES